MNTSKLFHTVVVLGMALAGETACSDDADPKPTNTGDASTAQTSNGGTNTPGGNDAGTDAFAGWFGC